MIIRKLETQDLDDTLNLFNKTTQRDDFLYENLNKEQFISKFMTSKTTYDIHSLVSKKEDEVVGFISGVYDKEMHKAYITMVIVADHYQRQGIASKLLKQLEEVLLSKSLTQKKIEIVFFNPIGLSWTIPHTKATHPNAPGIDSKSVAYLFFKAHNYLDFAVQNVYYMDIKAYTFSHDTQVVLESVGHKGFKFAYYDIQNDRGLIELLDNLASPVWKKTVLNHVDKFGKDNTLLVPTYDHKVVGFTGPLFVEPNGRGYFAGIGTHSDFRGVGLGKALFAKLVMGLKELGADYMTLFTGENNPARRMYEKEGFKIVRTFIDMRKVIF